MNAPEKFAALNESAAEGLIELMNAQFAMFEHLVALNLKATKSAYEDAINYVHAVSSAKDPQEVFNLSAAAAQPALDKAMAYSREVQEVAAKSQGRITKLVHEQTDGFHKNFLGLIEQYSKNLPGGSEFAVAALKSMFANANSAYDTYSKVAKQTAELAQAQFAAACNSAQEAHKKAA